MYKTERIGLVLTKSEKAAVAWLAEAEGGLSQAAIIRRLIREAAQRKGMWPPRVDANPRVLEWQIRNKRGGQVLWPRSTDNDSN